MTSLKKVLSTVGKVGVLSFLSLEIVFYYFSQEGTSKYPENIVIPILVLTVGLILENLVFSRTIGLLTFYISAIGTVFLVDWFFSNSPDPAILTYNPNSSGIGPSISAISGSHFLFDMLFIGVIGASLLLGVEFLSIAVIKSLYSRIKNLPLRRKTIPERVRGIIKIFDKHPWIIPILITIISLVVGYILGKQ